MAPSEINPPNYRETSNKGLSVATKIQDTVLDCREREAGLGQEHFADRFLSPNALQVWRKVI